MSWIAWKKVCSSLRCGGLGIGSLLATNFAMISKWWWRFHTNTNSLWRSIIISIHGERGGFDYNECSLIRLPPSPWKTILGISKPLMTTNVNLNSIFSKSIGNGASTRFWSDVWFGTTDLKSIFPRLHALETDKGCLVSDRCTLLLGGVHFVWAWRRRIREVVEREQLDNLLGLLQHFCPTNMPDSWICNLNNTNKFSVSSMRSRIEDSILLSSLEHVRWNKSLPLKINIHSWRLYLDRLPTRCNLDDRGIDLNNVRCPVCDDGLETAQHLFVDCLTAKTLWCMITSWWCLTDYPNLLCNLISWADNENLNSSAKNSLDVVIQATTWVIWRYRNRVCFDPKPPQKDTLGDEIKVLSHSCHRCKNRTPNWFDWISNPKLACANIM